MSGAFVNARNKYRPREGKKTLNQGPNTIYNLSITIETKGFAPNLVEIRT
jgi:hypothetical protein